MNGSPERRTVALVAASALVVITLGSAGVAAGPAPDESSEQQLASAQARGRTALTQGRKDLAARALEDEIAIRRTDPTVEPARTFEALLRLGMLLNDIGPYDRAERVLREALELHDSLRDRHRRLPDLFSALERAVSRLRPDDPERETLLIEMLDADPEPDAGGLYRLGSYYLATGRADLAEQRFAQALTLAESGTYRNGWGVSAYLLALARTERVLERPEMAEQRYREALSESERFLGLEHPRLAWPLKSLGRFLLDEGRDTEALLYLDQAVDLEQRAWGRSGGCGCPASQVIDGTCGAELESSGGSPSLEDPLIVELQQLNGSSARHRRAGEFEDAIESAQGALELRARIYGGASVELADGLDAVAELLIRRTRHDEAIETLMQSAAIRRPLASTPDQRLALAASLERLANSLRIRRRYDEAWRVIDEEIRLHERDGRWERVARRSESAGHLARTIGETLDARILFERAAGYWREMAGDGAPEIVRLLASVATTHLAEGAYDDAEAVLAPLLAEVEARWPRERSTLLQVRHPLGTLYRRTGRAQAAEALQLAE